MAVKSSVVAPLFHEKLKGNVPPATVRSMAPLLGSVQSNASVVTPDA